MKSLILNFVSFSSKDKSKLYYKFDLYDIENKVVYPTFVDSQFCYLPNGVTPSKDEEKKNFPALAEVQFCFEQYKDKAGIIRFAPRVRGVDSWKKYEIK